MGLTLMCMDYPGEEEAQGPLVRDPPGLQFEGSRIALRSCFLFFSVMLQQCISSFTLLSPLCTPQLSLSYLPISFPTLPLPSPISSSASFKCSFGSEPHHSVCMGWHACLIHRARLRGAPTHGPGIS